MTRPSQSEFPIAVVGVACRFPQAPDPDAFWRLLSEGRSAVTRVPADRWPAPGAEDSAGLGYGAFLDRVDLFDADFFGVSPREAVAMDPQQRLVLELGWEVLEHAGIAPGSIAGTGAGVFAGAIAGDYAQLLARQGPAAIGRHTLGGLNRGLIANRLSYALGIGGPSMTVDAAQASGLVAVHLACQSLRLGECELALAGGVNLNVVPESAIAVQRFGGISPDGRCFTFDQRANGYVRGEGGGLVALKPLDLALGEGDRVLAVIRGSAVNGDGASDGLTVPSESAQAEVLGLAYERAGVGRSEVAYVELHGTGTPVGDPVEAAALGAALGSQRPPGDPLRVGSVKTNIGHLEGAAGIAGLIKAVLCLERAAIPASLNFERANPRIPLADLNLAVQDRLEPWPGDGARRLAGVSSFGMGGVNCHVVLESSPSPSARGRAAAPPPAIDGVAVWPLCAKSEAALRDQASRLLEVAAADPPPNPRDVARALFGRSTFGHRAVVLGDSPAQLREGLESVVAGRGSRQAPAGRVRVAGRVAFVFPGQGSQWPAMAAGLFESAPAFRRSVEQCAEAFAPHLEWSLTDVLRGEDGAAPLARIDVVQPALFTMMVSLARLWQECGVEPVAVVGHSLGEIAAAHVAGAISLESAARLAATRSRILSELAGVGEMTSIWAGAEALEERLERWRGRIELAAVNGPSSVVVSGDLEALAELREECERDGIQARAIPATIASHSRFVDGLRERMLAAGASIEPRSADVSFVSTVSGEAIDTAGLDARYWYSNLRRTVRFDSAVRALLDAEVDVFVEVAPHPVLAVAVGEIADDADRDPASVAVVGSLRREEGGPHRFALSLGEAHVAGVAVDWASCAGGGGTHVDLPTYAFQRRRYWLDGTSSDEPAPPTAAARLTDLSVRERPSYVLDLVRSQAAEVLGHAAADWLGTERTFKELGLDSLGAVELRNRIAAATGLRLEATLAFDYPTVGDLAEHLLAEMAPSDAQSS